MPVLTTTRGLDIVFRADAIIAVADRDPEGGADVTCVYGLGPNFQKIAEPVDTFLTRIGKVERFARFTRPNGSPIWFNVDTVDVAMTAQEGLFGAEVKAVIVAGPMTQSVKETLDAVRANLAAHGAAI